jgi:antitoxin FitA
MATITLKNIPNSLFERLKALAKIRHRSLNSEIIYCLEKSASIVQEDPQVLRKELEEFRSRVRKKGQLGPEEIEKAINSGRP